MPSAHPTAEPPLSPATTNSHLTRLKFYFHGNDVSGTAGGFTMKQDPLAAENT